MLLEAFKANTDAGYIIVPRMRNRLGYISFDFMGMAPDEVSAWKLVLTIPQVRRARPTTAEEYIAVLQSLGIRAALSGTVASHALRAEYITPLSRRVK